MDARGRMKGWTRRRAEATIADRPTTILLKVCEKRKEVRWVPGACASWWWWLSECREGGSQGELGSILKFPSLDLACSTDLNYNSPDLDSHPHLGSNHDLTTPVDVLPTALLPFPFFHLILRL